jgi:hypothetical protein
VAVVESLAALVGSIGDYQGREYQELKKRVLAAHGRSRWEKLDSLLSFPKMGASERPSVVSQSLIRIRLCAGFVSKKKPEEDALFCLIKYATFLPPFLSNAPGTGKINPRSGLQFIMQCRQYFYLERTKNKRQWMRICSRENFQILKRAVKNSFEYIF